MATDLGMGQPLETALSSCVVAVRLGEALSLDTGTLRDVYYQALLRYIGCNAETYLLAALVGDELALRHDFAAVDPGDLLRLSIWRCASFGRQTPANRHRAWKRSSPVGSSAFLS